MSGIPTDKYTNHRFTAYIGHYLSFGNYLGCYKNAFDVLITEVYESDRHVDRLAYPILFIARHCLELGFKTNIRYFLKYSEKHDFKKVGTHDLEKLFGAFKLHVSATIKNLEEMHGIIVDDVEIEEFNAYCADVEKLTNIFHQLDKNSDSFRYPVDKENNNSFETKETINILEVKELYDRSMILLTYTADVFSKYTDFVDHINEIYEQEMREHNYGYY